MSALKKLIERYETITLEEITRMFEQEYSLETIRENLTGFGNVKKCIVCLEVDSNCERCVYNSRRSVPISVPCFKDDLKKSFNAIGSANDAEALLDAYRARAAVLRDFAKSINLTIDDE